VKALKDQLDHERLGEVNIYQLAKFTKDAGLRTAFELLVKTAVPGTAI
jgi:hypothetical protein